VSGREAIRIEHLTVGLGRQSSKTFN